MGSIAELLSMEKAKLWHGLARLTSALSLIVLVFAAAFGGLIFSFLGSYMSLTEVMEPWQAGAIVGGGVVLLVLVLLAFITRYIDRQGRKAEYAPLVGAVGNPRHDAVAFTPATNLAGVLGDLFGARSFKSRDIVIGALVTGMVLGASPRLRQLLFSQIKGR